jgi:hypothetical protein
MFPPVIVIVEIIDVPDDEPTPIPADPDGPDVARISPPTIAI